MVNLKGKSLKELKEIATERGISFTEKATVAQLTKLLEAEAKKSEKGAGNVIQKDEEAGNEVNDSEGLAAPGEIGGDNGGGTDEEFEADYKPTDVSDVPITMLPVANITPSKLNFFKELSVSKYAELKESIKNNGLMVPIIVRKNVNGDDPSKEYEILAGENRHRVLLDLGKLDIPARIVEVTDDKAKEILVDTNVAQRQDLTAMEIARAYHEKKSIIGNRQGQRNDIKGGEGGTTWDMIGQEYGKSGMTVGRYLRLMNLTPALQERIDSGEVSAKVGMELGLLDQDIQTQIFQANQRDVSAITTGQVSKVKKIVEEKRKVELEKPENKDKKKEDIKVTVKKDEIKAIFAPPAPQDKILRLKFSALEIDTEKFNEEFIGFLNDNTQEFLVDILYRYFSGKSSADNAENNDNQESQVG